MSHKGNRERNREVQNLKFNNALHVKLQKPKAFCKKNSFSKNSGTEKWVDTRLQKVVSQNFWNVSYLSLKLLDFAEKNRKQY